MTVSSDLALIESRIADAVNLLEKDRPLSAQVLPQSTGPGRWAD